jgi:hypothetical protein
MENQKGNSGCTGVFWGLVMFVLISAWGAGGISELYRRYSQPAVVGEWKGEDDQTVIMAFGKDGWFEMRNHKGEVGERGNTMMSDEDFSNKYGGIPPPLKETTPQQTAPTQPPMSPEERKRIIDEIIKEVLEEEQAIRESEGVPNMRYKIDYDEDPPWLDIIAFDKAGYEILTIKCIMKQPNRNTLIVKFPLDYTQLLGHIPLDISRYDRPTSFSGQEENRIKLLRKATLAVPITKTIFDTKTRRRMEGESAPPVQTTPGVIPPTETVPELTGNALKALENTITDLYEIGGHSAEEIRNYLKKTNRYNMNQVEKILKDKRIP